MKNKTIGKIATAKIKSLIAFDNYSAPTKAIIRPLKLSDFYSSRTTHYAQCLNESPFIIKTDNDSITSAGYSKNCKAIVTLDDNSPVVKKKLADAFTSRLAEIEKEKQIASAAVIAARQTEEAFDNAKERFAAKWLEINGSYHISHKEANQFAWKKQNYLGIEKVDIVLLRSLIKQYFRSL